MEFVDAYFANKEHAYTAKREDIYFANRDDPWFDADNNTHYTNEHEANHGDIMANILDTRSICLLQATCQRQTR
jgi:hypothetical protein